MAWFKCFCKLREADTGQTGIDPELTIKPRRGDWDNGLASGGTDVALQLDWTGPIGRLTSFGAIDPARPATRRTPARITTAGTARSA